MPNDITLTLKSTSRQITLSYTAPDASVCTIEVSEDPSYSPVVNDVNASLFTGANSDDRTGSLGAGTTSRQVLIGTIQNPAGTISNLAGDSKRYGRALQPVTTHYIRVTCGTHTGTGSIATKNIPLGLARGDEQPMASAGTYAFPSIHATDRTQTIIDPNTGIKLRKLSQPGEDTTGGEIDFLASGAPWPFAQSTITDSHGVQGYLATMPTGGGSTRLYFVTETESRFLGTPRCASLTGIPTTYLGVKNGGAKFGTNPTQLFAIMGDNSGNAHVVMCQLPASGDTYYDSSVAADTFASCTWSDRTPSPNHLTKLFQDFAALDSRGFTFDATKFAIGSQQWTQGKYLCTVNFRGNQDTYAWLAAIDTSTNPATVTGLTPQYQAGAASGANSARWCGIHTAHPIIDPPNHAKLSWTSKTPNGSGVTLWMTALSGAMDASQTTVTFTTNTPTDSTTSDTAPYNIQAGDEVYLDSQGANQEIGILGSFVSGTTWNITRGTGGTSAKTHADAAPVQMGCRAHRTSDATAVGPNWWDFVNDPHGADTTGTYYISQLANNTTYAGHEGFANGTGIAEGGWEMFIGPAMTNNTTFNNSDSPSFAGQAKSGSGDSWQKHAGAAQQTNADSTQGTRWGADAFCLDADNELSPSSLTNITGSLWKYASTFYWANGAAVLASRKKLAMLALNGTHPLLDISSTATGDVILGTSGDNYKYCVANAVNECRTGSAVGDIYINAPGITGSSTCGDGSQTGNWALTSILCFGHPAAYGGSIIQLGIVDANSTGKWNRALTQGLQPYKLMNKSSDAHQTPDGKWMMFPSYDGFGAAHEGIWLAKVPIWPGYDGINRNDFYQKPITVSAVGGATEALIEFGYDPNFYCTSRSEVCVSAASNNPYFFASESFTAVSCSSGCTINIPVIPNRVVYYRIKWRDSGHSVVQTSNTFLLAEDSAPEGSAPAPPSTPSVKLVAIAI